MESDKKQDTYDSIEKAYDGLLSRYSSKIQEHGGNASLINSFAPQSLEECAWRKQEGESRPQLRELLVQEGNRSKLLELTPLRGGDTPESVPPRV
jgi:hypothetical protein